MPSTDSRVKFWYTSVYKKFSDLQHSRFIFLSTLFCIFIYLFLYHILDQHLLSHSPWDSYTLQAVNWWKGNLALDQNYSYLELANYNGRIFVSFPPTPTVIMFFLVPFFEEVTPNNLVSSIYCILSFALILWGTIRSGADKKSGLILALLFTFASSLFPISLNGGVWFQAQNLNFLLLVSSLIFFTVSHRYALTLALTCYALALGCRPHDIFFAPVILLLVKEHFKKLPKPQISAVILSLICPTLICIGYGLLNYYRFENPFEFGHTYLPEFQSEVLGQFHWKYMSNNLNNVLRMPAFSITQGIQFPLFNGFAFYITNPIFISLAIKIFHYHKKLDRLSLFIIIGCVVQFAFLLSHRTMGGWHFGVRYLVDMLPFLWFFLIQFKPKANFLDYLLCFFGITINFYGASLMWIKKIGF